MARFYGQVKGRTKTIASRCGSHALYVVARSYKGSVAINLTNHEGTTMLTLSTCEDSDYSPSTTLWQGTLSDFLALPAFPPPLSEGSPCTEESDS